MRIVYFNANLKVGQDGVTRCVYKMIESVNKRGHQAIAITSTLPIAEPPIHIFKVPSVVLPLQKDYRIALPGYRFFAEYVAGFKPDILHINSPCTLGFSAMKYAKQFVVPIVATYHTHFPTYLRYYNLTRFEGLSWRLIRSLYNNMNCVFVPTMPILKELEQQGIRRLEYLPNGVDAAEFNPSYRSTEWRKKIGCERPIILFVSRLVWEKDLRVLAEMYQVLCSHRDDFEMVVVGEGNARQELEHMMPKAHFLGYQFGAALSTIFASADIFVFPSTTETFGLVTLEAMSSGLSPVAAKVGGAVEIIEEWKSGLFARAFDGIDMAVKVEWLLDHPLRRKEIGEQARARAYTYRWNPILDQLFESYETIIETSRRRRFLRAS